MLSSSNHQYPSPFIHRPSGNTPAPTEPMMQQRSPMAGLDALATGSQYALQQMQQNADNTSQKQKQRSSSDATHGNLTQDQSASALAQKPVGGRSTGGPVRRRISRACDQCNQLRTKCDGKTPCAHCVEFGLSCEYARERKKRGKASRKDVAAQQTGSSGDAEQTSPKSANDGSSEDQNGQEPQKELGRGTKRRRSSSQAPNRFFQPPRTSSLSSQPMTNGAYDMEHVSASSAPGPLLHRQSNVGIINPQHGINAPIDTYANNSVHSTSRLPPDAVNDRRLPYGTGPDSVDEYHRSVLHHSAVLNDQQFLHSGAALPSNMMHHPGMSSYAEAPYPLPSPQSQHAPMGNFRMGESPGSAGFLVPSPNAGSPGWLALPSPNAVLFPPLHQNTTSQSLRYPVLKYILPRISSIIPISLACDLLELYFSSSSTAFVQPASPYILGFLLRKRSVLRQKDPRPCSQALLASILWVAAQTSESSFLTSPPSQRGKICHQLLELTVSLLNPLIHTTTDGSAGYGNNSMINGIALGGFGMANPSSHDLEGGSTGATAALDDVATYINLATVISASEYKSASLRWWNAAWSLARELKLGRELPSNPGPANQNHLDREGGEDPSHLQDSMHPNMAQPLQYSEEEREERRRIWWLLYTVDRHLALCYNRPLFLLDVECDRLLQPENDAIWQAGDYYPPENHVEAMYFRRRGPGFECTGHSIFGYFLPLMTILGEIVDINHARNHPRFGSRFRSGGEWEEQATEISHQLEAYGRSLKEFEARYIPPDGNLNGDHNVNRDGTHHDANSPGMHSNSTSTTRMTEAVLQTKIVVSYATHLMHTLHILLNGKWDPISLLDDNDLWISSQSFISATGHAVSAAEAINDILEYDPDLSFMPFFFGIYLLQGSFLLLLIADKLQGEASPNVVKACESIVRAHEVCCVTLNTEYQRNFRKVMRSALAQVRGRVPDDFGEQQKRRREVLALYRWTGDGSGLAL